MFSITRDWFVCVHEKHERNERNLYKSLHIYARRIEHDVYSFILAANF